MSRGKYLSEAEILWAWKKWNQGYIEPEIAKTLGCCTRTVIRKFGQIQDNGNKVQYVSRADRKKLPELRYDV